MGWMGVKTKLVWEVRKMKIISIGYSFEELSYKGSRGLWEYLGGSMVIRSKLLSHDSLTPGTHTDVILSPGVLAEFSDSLLRIECGRSYGVSLLGD